MKNPRLFWQVFFPALAIILFSVVATTWVGTRSIRSFYYQQMRVDIMNRALLLRPHVQEVLKRAAPDELEEFCRTNGRQASTRITVIRGDGRVLADSHEDPGRMDNHGTRPEVVLALSGSTGSSFRFSHTLGRVMLYVAIPLDENSPKSGVLRLAVPATALEEVLAAIYHKILLGTLLVGLLAAVFAYWLAWRISRPLEEMRRSAERLAAGPTDRPVVMEKAGLSRETAELARALNSMANQINTRIRTITRQRNELEAVFSSMADSVLAIGVDHSIIRVNPAAAELFGIDPDTARGRPMQGVLRNRVLQDFINRALASSTPLEEDLVLNIETRELTLKGRSVPLLDGEGGRLGVLLVMNNLTRVNRLETIRRNFVANVSHELKTPVTAIRGYVETLLDGAWKDPGDLKKFLTIISRQAGRLEAIIDDLLSLARIEDSSENNNMAVRRERVCPILENSILACDPQAADKGVLVRLECSQPLSATVNRSMLEQAVINLLTNAIRYSHAGEAVTVKADVQPDEEGRKQLRISICDRGPGIGPEHIDHIFERFYRCDRGRSRRDGGTGLGLAIVNHIARCHGGEVEVRSTVGAGSVFTLVLPIR